jgi:WhiB family redox-sensing transcriptional regulator
VTTEAWREDANCKSMNPDLFFPGPNTPIDDVVEICFACPVRIACLEHALANGEILGVWGGLTQQERRALHRKRRLHNYFRPLAS